MSDLGADRSDRVVVRVIVVRSVLEPRTDVDGVEDFYEIAREVVSEREWIEYRATALAPTQEVTRYGV